MLASNVSFPRKAGIQDLAAESASRLDARVRGRDKRLSREVRVLSLAAQVQPRARKTSGARLVELPGTDHLFFVDDAGDRAIAEIEEFLTGSRSAPVVDRVLATVVFTDIVDSTKRADTKGDQAWRDLLEAHDAAVRRELGRFRGREVKSLGDGFLATFDGPARAIHCASAIRDQLRGLQVPVRIGVHTGEVELTENDVRGIAVHIASRVARLGGADDVLVSRTVKDLVAGSGSSSRTMAPTP